MEPNNAIEPSRLAGIVEFIQAAERLKDTLRSGITSRGRAESAAEHSWRLCLLVIMFGRELAGYDQLKLLKLCILHDLGEAISGDVPAIYQDANDHRAERERQDLATLCTPLPPDLRREILDLWDEYNAASSLEAAMAKGFDKLETMLQHLVGRNSPDFDYEFNLEYGTAQMNGHPLLKQIRALVDAATRDRIASARQPAKEWTR